MPPPAFSHHKISPPIIAGSSFSNAFNSIDREIMFREIRNRIPTIAAWMESCYSGQPLFLLGDDFIHSCCGVQQGDPLGPLGFALTLHPLIEKIKTEVPNLPLNVWYLDDGTLMGSPEELTAALSIIESVGPTMGLHLNRSKSLLFIPEEANALLSSLPAEIPTTRHGFSLLGCPVGPPDYCEEVFQARLEKLKASLDVLLDMGDSQLETTLLRSCLALPKVAFVLRACPPSHVSRTAKDFDIVIRQSLERIVGGPLSDWSWLKASLPSSRGRLRSASLHAPAAFLASSLCSQSLVERIIGHPLDTSPHISSTVTALATAANCPDWQSLGDIDAPLQQHHLSLAIYLSASSHLPLPSVRKPWPYPPVCHMLGTG